MTTPDNLPPLPPVPRKLRIDRDFSEYPLGTKAHAFNGGAWLKMERGWKWNGPDGNGGTFATPGGDACGACMELPIEAVREPAKPDPLSGLFLAAAQEAYEYVTSPAFRRDMPESYNRETVERMALKIRSKLSPALQSEPAKDQPASGDLLTMEPSGYIDALASSATGVEARVCEDIGPFIWGAVRTESGELDKMTIQPFDDELTGLVEGWEWRRFRLVESPQPPEGGQEKP